MIEDPLITFSLTIRYEGRKEAEYVIHDAEGVIARSPYQSIVLYVYGLEAEYGPGTARAARATPLSPKNAGAGRPDFEFFRDEYFARYDQRRAAKRAAWEARPRAREVPLIERVAHANDLLKELGLL